MTVDATMLVAIGVLAVGTYGLRVAGPLLASRVRLSPRVRQWLNTSAVVLLAALVATAALTEAQEFAGYARPAGVAAGGVLAAVKAPFVAVVLVAAATAAGLRLLGVP